MGWVAVQAVLSIESLQKGAPLFHCGSAHLRPPRAPTGRVTSWGSGDPGRRSRDGTLPWARALAPARALPAAPLARRGFPASTAKRCGTPQRPARSGARERRGGGGSGTQGPMKGMRPWTTCSRIRSCAASRHSTGLLPRAVPFAALSSARLARWPHEDCTRTQSRRDGTRTRTRCSATGATRPVRDTTSHSGRRGYEYGWWAGPHGVEEVQALEVESRL